MWDLIINVNERLPGYRFMRRTQQGALLIWRGTEVAALYM
jgi:hypothetical protein